MASSYNVPNDWSETEVTLEQYNPPNDWSETQVILQAGGLGLNPSSVDEDSTSLSLTLNVDTASTQIEVSNGIPIQPQPSISISTQKQLLNVTPLLSDTTTNGVSQGSITNTLATSIQTRSGLTVNIQTSGSASSPLQAKRSLPRKTANVDVQKSIASPVEQYITTKIIFTPEITISNGIFKQPTSTSTSTSFSSVTNVTSLFPQIRINILTRPLNQKILSDELQPSSKITTSEVIITAQSIINQLDPISISSSSSSVTKSLSNTKTLDPFTQKLVGLTAEQAQSSILGPNTELIEDILTTNTSANPILNFSAGESISINNILTGTSNSIESRSELIVDTSIKQINSNPILDFPFTKTNSLGSIIDSDGSATKITSDISTTISKQNINAFPIQLEPTASNLLFASVDDVDYSSLSVRRTITPGSLSLDEDDALTSIRNIKRITSTSSLDIDNSGSSIQTIQSIQHTSLDTDSLASGLQRTTKISSKLLDTDETKSRLDKATRISSLTVDIDETFSDISPVASILSTSLDIDYVPRCLYLPIRIQSSQSNDIDNLNTELVKLVSTGGNILDTDRSDVQVLRTYTPSFEGLDNDSQESTITRAETLYPITQPISISDIETIESAIPVTLSFPTKGYLTTDFNVQAKKSITRSSSTKKLNIRNSGDGTVNIQVSNQRVYTDIINSNSTSFRESTNVIGRISTGQSNNEYIYLTNEELLLLIVDNPTTATLSKVTNPSNGYTL